MDADVVRSWLRDLSAVGTDLDSEGDRALMRACAIIEDMTASKCKRLITEAGDRPVLQVYMSDGWTTDVNSKDGGFVGHVRVTRSGRLRTEFCIQRVIVKSKVGEQDMQLAIKIERPRCLAGKKCGDLWTAAFDFQPTLKMMGHRGVSISIYLQDGLFAKPFGKRMLARHQLFFHPDHCPIEFATTASRDLADLRDWALYWRCTAHSCSLALKWALRPFVSADILESAHITLASLSHASTALLGEVRHFVVRYVVFDRPSLVRVDDTEVLWTFLDVEPSHLELFLRVNPTWDGEHLRVSAALQGQDDAISAVECCIKYCMRWAVFSETRWAKVGLCGRYFLRSLFVGIDHIAKLTMDNDKVSNWHLNGFKKGTAPTRLYLGVAAASGRASEVGLLQLMTDDRLLIHSEACWAVMEEELQYLLQAPVSLWSSIGAVLRVNACDFRRWVVEATVVSMGFLWMDVWSLLEEAPWKFAVGDISEKVAALKATDAPSSDPIVLKMQVMLQMGLDDEVLAALQMLRESSMTTILVEQAHASGAQIMRRHAQLGMDAMCARSTVHNARTLFHLSEFEKQERKIVRVLENLKKGMASLPRCTARQAYLKMVIHTWKESCSPSAGPSNNAVRRSCFRHHGISFQRLGHEQVKALKRQAARHREDKMQELLNDKAHWEGKLAILRKRKHESLASGAPNHVDSCRFDDTDLRIFMEKWQGYNLSDISGRLKPPPEQPPADVQELLQEQQQATDSPLVPDPSWLAAVIANRELFDGVGFYNEPDDGWQNVLYKFVVATQNPRRAVFLECRRRGRTLAAIESMQPGEMPDQCSMFDTYDYLPLKFVCGDKVPIVGDDSLVVVQDLAFHADVVHDIGSHVAFASFVRFHPAGSSAIASRPRATGSARPTVTPEILADLKLEFPWLSENEIESMVRETGTTHSEGSAGKHDGPRAPTVLAAEIPEDVAAEVATALADIRAELEFQEEDDMYFTTRVLGGRWTMANRGVPADAIGSFSRGAPTEVWCRSCRWPRQRTFHFSKYSHEGARQLADEVCRRGNYFMNCWVKAGSPDVFCFKEVIGAYPENFEFIDWLTEQPLDSACFSAGVGVRALVPSDMVGV